ncbi:hypothetical protein ACTMTJ_34420 [Phytohabitans sp. LJ34]|uniref:hypothetical protein n=1 Tax=Phytohabitans sp. LJ34 TaxID=3452217 RepID=UPI003F8B4DB1
MTSLGEAALGQLAIRLADWRTLRSPMGSVHNRHGRHLRDADVVRHGNALTDLVAVVESFTVARLLNLRPAVSHDQVMRWADRVKMWRQHGGVDLSSYQHWQAFLGFVEVRNALSHGLGRLTDRQLGKFRNEVLGQIAAAGVRLDGDLVLPIPDDVSRCGEIGGDFVRFLDLAAPST